VFGTALTLPAVAIGALNFHLSFVRPILHTRVGGSLEGYKHVSGLPMIGSFLVVAGGLLGFGSRLCAGLGFLALAVDTGGCLWLLITLWRNPSLLD
jgi:hypothetical protein